MQHKLPAVRKLSAKYPITTVLAAGIIVITCFAVIISSRFNTEVTHLIPAHAEKTALYFSLLEKTGKKDKAYIVFSSDKIMDHLQDIEKTAGRIVETQLVQSSSWKLSGETEAFLRDVYARKSPLFLSRRDMDEFVRRLAPEGMAHELEKTRQRLTLHGNPQGTALADPLNFSELFGPHLRFSDDPFDMSSGYFLTPDRKNLVMVLTPTGSPYDTAFSHKFVTSMESILDTCRGKGLSAEITGSHAVTLHEASAIKREIVRNALFSIIAVFLIFRLFFGSLKGLLYVGTPVAGAVIVTTGLALFASDSLSAVNVAFAGLIAALGIDLGLVLYVRYLIDMETCPHPVECMDRSIEAVYRSITTAVITTALTFLPLVFSSYRDLRELGLLIAAGMIVCWVFLFTIAPLSIKPSSGRFIEIRLLKDIARYSMARPYRVIAAALGMSLLLAVFIPRISFPKDITKLDAGSSRARRTVENLKDSYLGEQGVIITDTSMDMELALIRSHEIKDALAKYFANITTTADILPPMAMQKKNLALLEALDADGILRDFRKIAAEKGFPLPAVSVFIDRLQLMIRNREPVTLRDIEPVKDRLNSFLINEDDQWRVMVTGNLKPDTPESVLAGYHYTGPAFITQELFSFLKKDAALIGIVSLLLVNIALFLDFRKIFPVLLCQVPAVVSILCTLGIMGLTGIRLNVMGAVVFALLFGIGTDYAVHLLHRYQSDRDLSATFLHTGKAVLIAGFTTLAGFAPIGFSSHAGLATIGQVASIGTVICVILSFTVIPALLSLHEKSFLP